MVTQTAEIREPERAGPAADVPSPVSFDDYVAARGAALVRFAILLTGDDHRAEDIVQEALAKSYLRWGRIRRSDDPDVYLRRMVANLARSWWRRRANREVPVERTGESSVPGDVGDEAAERDALWRLIAALPYKQRAVVVLRYYEDLEDLTIAEILGCAPVTVRTHARRALNRLREDYSEGDVR